MNFKEMAQRLNIFKRVQDLDRRLMSLGFRLDGIENALEKQRLVNFIKVVNYTKGMPLKPDLPRTIDIPDLEKRIDDLEATHKEK